MATGSLGKLFRRGAKFQGLYKETYRLLFGVLFWVFFVASYVMYLLDEEKGAGLAPVTLAFVALAAVYFLLPWDSNVSWRRMLVVPVFLVAMFAVGYLSRTQPFYALAVAHGVFLFGFRRSILYATAILPLLFLQLLLVDHEHNVVRALGETAIWIPSFAFIIGLCASVIEADRRRREAQDLLARLESAHLELGRYAARVRELAISEERTRIAREMHDSVGHYLTVVNVQLEAACKLMRSDPARERVERAKDLASEALSEVRRSVRALKPLAVEERAGPGALRALVQSFDGVGLAFSFKVEGDERELPPDAELALYRALQEGLTNALKHSNARRARSVLTFEEESVRLTVSDDGEGAPEGAVGAGFGLSALKGRVEALGGTMRAGNAPEGGFVFEVELPVGVS